MAGLAGWGHALLWASRCGLVAPHGTVLHGSPGARLAAGRQQHAEVRRRRLAFLMTAFLLTLGWLWAAADSSFLFLLTGTSCGGQEGLVHASRRSLSPASFAQPESPLAASHISSVEEIMMAWPGPVANSAGSRTSKFCGCAQLSCFLPPGRVVMVRPGVCCCSSAPCRRCRGKASSCGAGAGATELAAAAAPLPSAPAWPAQHVAAQSVRAAGGSLGPRPWLSCRPGAGWEHAGRAEAWLKGMAHPGSPPWLPRSALTPLECTVRRSDRASKAIKGQSRRPIAAAPLRSGPRRPKGLFNAGKLRSGRPRARGSS